MGFFGGFISKVKEKVSSACTYVKEKVSNTWAKFTGKEEFEKADKLYNEIKARFNREKDSYERKMQDLTIEIEKSVFDINEYKKKIREELFTQYMEYMKRLKNVNIGKEFAIEEYIGKGIEIEYLKSKESLYKIDFNKSKFKSNFLAVVTLGFFTRKKAKETLEAVREQECKINEQISKMQSEIVRVERVRDSLSQVASYYKELIEIYVTILDRLNGVVNSVYFRCMNLSKTIMGAGESIKHLPKVHQSELKAAATLSKVLSEMTKKQIIEINEEQSKKYKDETKIDYDAFIKAAKVA